MKLIYFDHAATTPPHPNVLQTMSFHMKKSFGNASSIHQFGRHAKWVLNQARDDMAFQLGCKPEQLLFTSGGTECNNTAIFGVAWAAWQRQITNGAQNNQLDYKPHVVTTQIEHPSVLHACKYLEKFGFSVTYAAPDSTGRVSLHSIRTALRPNTCLVSVMYSNHELGTVQPVQEIGYYVRERGILMHTDAVQALGYVTWNLNTLPFDFVSFSAHKINGPKGIGVLYARSYANWDPLLYGGSQEHKHRAGTENIIAVAGFAKSLEYISTLQKNQFIAVKQVRDAMWTGLQGELGDRVIMNGHSDENLPHILNVSILDVPTETMLMNLDLMGIMASSGSACTAGAFVRSHVLSAMNVSKERQHTAIRFSFGMGNTMQEALHVVQQIATIVARVRTSN